MPGRKNSGALKDGFSKSKIKENTEKNLQRYCGLIDWVCAGGFAGKPGFALTGQPGLVTLGEFALTGLHRAYDGPKSMNNQQIIEYLAVRIPGPETDVLAEKAKQYGIYIAAANYELGPEWPDFYFNTGFIINRKGNIPWSVLP